MYPSQSPQYGSMDANRPPSSQQQQQQQQQQPPIQQQQQAQGWSPRPNQPGQQQFAPAPRPNESQAQNLPPVSQAFPQGPPGPPMQTLQPNHADAYRALPAPPQMYAPPYHPGMQYQPQQPAPRQRTAIACRYCRRRKIRCSGFDTSEDGRCTNCQRFSQECIFTPVSAQAQAFVPAHTVYRGGPAPQNQQLYGAYGQPLPAPGSQPYQPQQPGQYPPPPQGYQQPQMYQQQPPPHAPQMQTPQGMTGQKRPTDEPHTPTFPPPNPGAMAQMPQQNPDGSYAYPNPMNMTPTDQTGQLDASTATTEGAQKGEEMIMVAKKPVVDVGVQTEDLGSRE